MVMRALILTTLAVLTLTACSQNHSDENTSGEEVLLTVEHRSEWRQLWIEGATDLPDGAFINFSVEHEIGRSTPSDEWPTANLVESGRATVAEGHYWTVVNTLNWPPGNVRIVVQFPLPPQPVEIAARYGEFGEHLIGDNVVTLSGMKAVEAEYQFEHRLSRR